MQDGASVQGTDPRQQQSPGTPPAPEPKPLPNPNGDLPKFDPSGQQSGQGGGPDGGDMTESEAVAYWRTQAMQAREEAKRFRMYRGIIEHLETHPQTVDALERMILGQAVDIAVDGQADSGDNGNVDPEQRILNDLGFDDNDNDGGEKMAQSQQPQSQDKKKLQDDELQRIRAEERARLEFERFMSEMKEQGIPDHAIDEFVNFINNPSGLTFHDLFAAYNANRQRAGKDPVLPQKKDGDQVQNKQMTADAARGQQAPTPMTVGQMPGDTDRPTEIPQGGGEVYLHKTSPNDL